MRRRCAAKAFSRTASYDAAISRWFAEQLNEPFGRLLCDWRRALAELRYGENPHQKAALYAAPGQRQGVTAARQVQGKELSYNNINDTDAALECLSEFAGEGRCGLRDCQACKSVRRGDRRRPLLEAYRKALSCDPVSAFGGIIAFNRALDAATAREITALFTEVIVAPAADPEALAIIC